MTQILNKWTFLMCPVQKDNSPSNPCPLFSTGRKWKQASWKWTFSWRTRNLRTAASPAIAQSYCSLWTHSSLYPSLWCSPHHCTWSHWLLCDADSWHKVIFFTLTVFDYRLTTVTTISQEQVIAGLRYQNATVHQEVSGPHNSWPEQMQACAALYKLVDCQSNLPD